MFESTPNAAFPFLSVLIFGPLLAGLVALAIRDERALRWWTLGVTLAAAVFSLPLYGRFDVSTAAFQFVEDRLWIPGLNVRYTLGVDGISLLLVLLTTWIMPLCVLASWKYIQTRVKEFMVCLLIMETAMVGVFCALDFVLFFIFWEAMLIPMALLIGIWGGPRRVYAAVKFFIYTMSGSVLLVGGHHRAVCPGGELQHSRADGAGLRAGVSVLGVPGVLRFLCHQGAHAALPHLVAGGACGGAHGGQRAPGQRAPEDGDLRFSALLSAHHAAGDAVVHAVCAGACRSPRLSTVDSRPWRKAISRNWWPTRAWATWVLSPSASSP